MTYNIGMGETEPGLHHRNIEKTAELNNFRQGFQTFVRNGTEDELVDLLDNFPQRGSNGQLIWLLTSGLAVKLTVGSQRQRHDLDVVVMDDENIWRWEMLGTDNVTPEQYWADMRFNPQFLTDSALTVPFRNQGRNYAVEIVHPTIIMAQKLSNAFGRNPREKDIRDSVDIARWWEGPQRGYGGWIDYVTTTVAALPNEEQAITEVRIIEVATKLFPR